MVAAAALAADDRTSLQERTRSDPVWFCREVLGTEPWGLQQRIAESVRDNRVTAVASCHASGKSWIAGGVSLWFLLSRPASRVVTTAPTNRQVEAVLWKEIRTQYRDARVPLGGRCMQQRLVLDDDWFAIGFASADNDTNAFNGVRGRETLVVVDEACGVSETIFGAIHGILSTENVRLLTIGNPLNIETPFGEQFGRNDITSFHISAFDTPNFTTFGITEADIASGAWDEKIGASELPNEWLVTPEWAAGVHATWGPESGYYQARVLGRFPDAAQDALIPRSWIRAAQERKIEPGAPHVFGVDVARFGEDRTVIVERRGNVARVIGSWGREDTMQTTGRVRSALIDAPAARANVDEIGIGAGVVDRLKEQAANVTGVNVGESAEDSEHFANRRAELFFALRGRFERDEIDLDAGDKELEHELAAIRFGYDSRGRIVIEKKDEMRKRIDRSPDRADALMLAFADRSIVTDIDMGGDARPSRWRP